MEKKDLLKIGMYVGLAFLLIIIVITIFHFTSNKDNVVIDLTPTEEEETKPLLNNTDYSEAYIRELVQDKKETLQGILENMLTYNLKKVEDEEVTDAEDEGVTDIEGEEVTSSEEKEEEPKDLAVSEQFITDMEGILSSDLMDEVYENIALVTDADIENVNFNVYRIDEDWLNELKSFSAVAIDNIHEYKLNLKEANPDRITSTITIVKCEKVCDIKEEYPFEIILDEETNTWKVDKIR